MKASGLSKPANKPLVVFCCGPSGSGKTLISNFLTGTTGIPDGYSPTRGVRILEFTLDNTSIELWDCSGDPAFLATWPVLANCCNFSLLLVVNTDSPAPADVSPYCLASKNTLVVGTTSVSDTLKSNGQWKQLPSGLRQQLQKGTALSVEGVSFSAFLGGTQGSANELQSGTLLRLRDTFATFISRGPQASKLTDC